jgi:glycosyltransferase involved in cell wall biosynthesis
VGKILFIAGFPPPASGQLIMQKKMYDLFRDEDKRLISLNFSNESKDFSKMSLAKIVKLLNVFLQICWAGLWQRNIEKVYYSLSGPKKNALVKDIVIGIPLNLFFKRKLVLQVHAGGYNKNFVESQMLFKIVGSIYRNVGHLLCLTEFQKNELVFLNAKTQTVVSNFCEDRAVPTSEHSEKEEGKLKLLSVGHLNANKGIAECMQLARLLREEGKSFHWKFIGSFKETDFEVTIREMITTLGLASSVEIQNEVANDVILEEYGKADFLIFLSNGPEGQPVVLIEGLMVAHAVIIAKDICGISEYIKDGFNGHVVNDYREVLPILLNSTNDGRRKLRSNARNTYLEKFSIASFTNTVQGIFGKPLREH